MKGKFRLSQVGRKAVPQCGCSWTLMMWRMLLPLLQTSHHHGTIRPNSSQNIPQRIGGFEHHFIVTENLLHSILIVLSDAVVRRSMPGCDWLVICMFWDAIAVPLCDWLLVCALRRFMLPVALSQVEQLLADLPEATAELNLDTKTFPLKSGFPSLGNCHPLGVSDSFPESNNKKFDIWCSCYPFNNGAAVLRPDSWKAATLKC